MTGEGMKPCPFCGPGTEVGVGGENLPPGPYETVRYIMCNTCLTRGPRYYGETIWAEAQAIEGWNTRTAAPATITVRRDRLEDLLIHLNGYRQSIGVQTVAHDKEIAWLQGKDGE